MIETATTFAAAEILTEAIKESILKYTNAEKNGVSYRSMPTAVMKAIAEYGAQNIYLFGENYRSHYDDDYCTFTYYNNVTGEYFNDEWATAFAAPGYDLYEWCYSFESAVKAGFVNIPLYLDGIKKKISNWLENEKITAADGLRVNVSRGRKWKGTGYLINTYTTNYVFGPTYGKGYNTSTSRIARVYDPMTNTINEVTAGMLDYLDLEEINAEYQKWAKTILETPYPTDGTINWITIGNIKPQEFLANVWLPAHTVDMSTAIDLRKVEEENKKNAAREKELPGLIEWVRSKGYKDTEEEILNEAIRIFNKNYAR